MDFGGKCTKHTYMHSLREICKLYILSRIRRINSFLLCCGHLFYRDKARMNILITWAISILQPNARFSLSFNHSVYRDLATTNKSGKKIIIFLHPMFTL